MAKSLKFGNVCLADYVARGEKNKHTLVNVFSGDVIVQEMPARLHFGLYAEYFPDSNVPHEVQIEVMLGEKIFGNFVVSVGSPNTDRPSVISISLFEMGVDRELTFKISASADGYRKTQMLSKKIFKAQVPAS